MKVARAIWVGVLAAAVVVLIFLTARAFGVQVDVTMIVGRWVLPSGGVLAWVVGALAQLINGAVSGLIYAVVFEYVTRRAGLWIGLAIGIGHALVAGIAIGFLPIMVRAIRTAMGLAMPTIADVPGAFLEYRGALAMCVFVGAHLVFGVLMGWWYGAPEHRVTGRA